MSLTLGKTFNRSYSIRVPLLDGFYNIGVFADKKSTFLLFDVHPDFKNSSFQHNFKINMFKNLESSKFCETFLELHNYRRDTLDISNQFKKVKDVYDHDLSYVLNETLIFSKVNLNDKEIFDCLNIYGFTMCSYSEEFVFILTERHHISKRLEKKIVRTSGIQIATTPALNFLEEFHQECKTNWKSGHQISGDPDKIIVINDIEENSIDETP